MQYTLPLTHRWVVLILASESTKREIVMASKFKQGEQVSFIVGKAKLFGTILGSLNSAQKEYYNILVGGEGGTIYYDIYDYDINYLNPLTKRAHNSYDRSRGVR
jgi:hypothetical protein